MRVLLIGASGFLGSALYEHLSLNCLGRYCVTGTYHANAKPVQGIMQLNLGDPEDIRRKIEAVEPEIIIHAGGLTNVDYCELNKDEARRVNIDGTREMIRATNAKVIYFSTNYVFDGILGNYTEADATSPLNFYGFTKTEAEKTVLEEKGNLVIRVATLFGYNKHNNKFLRRFFNCRSEKDEIDGCRELMVCSTYLRDIISNFENLMRYNGILHFSSFPAMDECYFLSNAIAGLGISTKVKEIPFSSRCAIAERPRNASLDTIRGITLERTSLEDALNQIRTEMKLGHIK